jgi:putative ABC transport system permease protein
LDKPAAINLYPVDFEAKDKIAEIIANYSKEKPKEDQLVYTDYVGLMMSSVTTIINAISYILISFVAISLVVSSIMIGIITNISVLERTKEIGILRAVGASKGDVSRVFNAETIIEGLAAGLVGIGVTELLILPINLLINNVFGLNAKAYLPPVAAVILVAISVFLTFIAGLIPSRSAAKKDPVVALRTE